MFSSTVVPKYRSDHWRCSVKKNCSWKFRNIHTKNLCWSPFLIKSNPSCLQLYQKKTPTQVFSYEYCEIRKNIYFEKYLRKVASIK